MKRAPPGPLWVAEPPAAYLVRPPAVVDCSVLVAILFDEERFQAAAASVGGHTLHAPFLLDHEVASVALKKRRAGAAAELLQAAVELYPAYGVSLHRVAPEAALPLADRYALSAYDAAYLALAAELRVPLLTFDDKLGRAAQRHLGSLQ